MVENRLQISDMFIPVKFRRGMREISKWFLTGLRSLTFTFCVGSLAAHHRGRSSGLNPLGVIGGKLWYNLCRDRSASWEIIIIRSAAKKVQ